MLGRFSGRYWRCGVLGVWLCGGLWVVALGGLGGCCDLNDESAGLSHALAEDCFEVGG